MSESAQWETLNVWKPGLLRCPDGHPHQMISDVTNARDVCTRCGMVQSWLNIARTAHE